MEHCERRRRRSGGGRAEMGWMELEDGEEELRLEWQILKRFLNSNLKSKKILNKISKLNFEIKKRYLTTTSTLPLTPTTTPPCRMPAARCHIVSTSTNQSSYGSKLWIHRLLRIPASHCGTDSFGSTPGLIEMRLCDY